MEKNVVRIIPAPFRRGFVKRGPKHEENPNLELIDRLAAPLFEAWERREKEYSGVYYLGEKGSARRAKLLFTAIMESIIKKSPEPINNLKSPDLREDDKEKARELYHLTSSLINSVKVSKGNVLEQIEGFFENYSGFTGDYLREALTIIGFNFAYEYKLRNGNVESGKWHAAAIDLYHFYTEIGLKKTARAIEGVIGERLNKELYEKWREMVIMARPVKKELKKALYERFEEKGYLTPRKLEEGVEFSEAPVVWIKGRIKSFLSSYRKMKRKGIPLEEISDFIGLSIMVPEEEFYNVLQYTLGKLKKLGWKFTEIEDYRENCSEEKVKSVVERILGNSNVVKINPRDNYHALHINIEKDGFKAEIQLMVSEKYHVHHTGERSHPLYKKKINVHEAREALAKAIKEGKKRYLVRVEVEGLGTITLDSNENEYLPLTEVFNPKMVKTLAKDIGLRGGKGLVLEMSEKLSKKIVKEVALRAISNTNKIEIHLKGKIIDETNSRVVVELEEDSLIIL